MIGIYSQHTNGTLSIERGGYRRKRKFSAHT